MKTFIIERKFKRWNNKAYCLQFDIDKFHIGGIDVNFCFLSYMGWFNFNINIFGLLSFWIRWSRKCDHAGFNLEIFLFGLRFHFNIYDCRHWDDETNDWEKYNQEEQHE